MPLLPTMEFGIRDLWDGIVLIEGKEFQFKSPMRATNRQRAAFDELAAREKQKPPTTNEELRQNTIDLLAIYMGDGIREALASEEDYPLDEVNQIRNFVFTTGAKRRSPLADPQETKPESPVESTGRELSAG